jgi:putative SOS response-associated peptidase YedK
MCGRYVLKTQFRVLANLYRLTTGPGVGAAPEGGIERALEPFDRPRFNVAPAQTIAVVREVKAGRALAGLKWGLVPRWAKDPGRPGMQGAPPPINARAETADARPTFRDAMARRRCLVPADGFYEWKRLDASGKAKRPYFVAMADGGNFAIAGIWERWEGPEGVLETCALLTTTPNELMATIHDRMPCIVPAERWDAWLDPGRKDGAAAKELLGPLPGGLLVATPVSSRVNSPKNDDPSLLEPVAVTDVEAPAPKTARSTRARHTGDAPPGGDGGTGSLWGPA